jgi:uncharacterized protein
MREDRTGTGGTRKLLSLDGGGIRGMITLGVLAHLEDLLREELRADERFVLSDYFDYVAGTSTGAVIAACIALGMRVEQIQQFYRDNAAAMFQKVSRWRQIRHLYTEEKLASRMREVFNGFRTSGEQESGRDLALGSPALRALLLVVMRNATTDSPWPVSSNPAALFNDRTRPDCNLDLPLWKLVRASTAAPIYFPPEVVELGGQRFVFQDGGVTTYNNPAFLLFLMATAEPYRLCWPVGTDRMLLVSVGTGTSPRVDEKLQPTQMNLLYNIGTIPAAMILATVNEQDMLCRVVGECRAGDPLDSEVGDLRTARGPAHPKLFTYLRYNAELSRAGLDVLSLADIDPAHVQKLDSISHLEALERVGRVLAEKRVQASDFAGFL